ncbi:Response regulator receiver domain-containing protein [Natronincola peptidivorans]|uniref:Stage 0 sporulation protein A homolog n=1 Tax=Natronincola peptidivorans TaxID=426128 RepID=A0A1I0G733_9FIRM|nr:SpoIIE family protein phosphatase [Natronincola peptidivorans]SET66615.1 Response regulator receiver domain-containing protein [Natronincola peptidivorans]
MTDGKIVILYENNDTGCDIKKSLRKYGHQVIEIIIGNETITEVLNAAPHVILVHITSRQDECLEICSILKKDKRTHNIPILGLFIDNQENQKDKYIQIGMNDYLDAPIQQQELIMKIETQMRIVKLQEKLYQKTKALEESIHTIRKQKNELEHNLTMASKIQEALIPKTLGNIPNCSFFWHFQPSGKVGGDIFDVFLLDEDHMGLYVIDVMGHGVASSMLAVALSEFLILDVDRGSPLKRKIDKPPYYEIIPPVEVIDYLNKRFPFTKYQHYFTIFYMVLNLKTGVFRYVRGAHPSPILVRNNGSITELDGYGTPVGFEFTEGYEEKTVYLETGDHLIIYTDGVFELKDEKNSAIEYEGFIEYLQKEIKGNHHNHYLTYKISQMAKKQEALKDDLSVLEMKWVKFI